MFRSPTRLVPAVLAVGLALFGVGWRPAAQESKAPADLAEVRLRLLRQDARLLEAAAAADLRRRLDPVFAGLEARIPAFADWAFRWRTGFLLMRSQIWAAVRHPIDGGGRGIADSLRIAAEKEMGAQFDALVLRAETTEPLLGEAWRQWRAGLDESLAGVRLDHELALGLGPAALSAPSVFEAPDATAAAALDDASADTLRSRGGRPILSRLIVRSPALIPAARVGEVVEAATGVFLAGGAAVMATAIGATLGFDFLLSRADEKANRADFEERMREGLAGERAALERRWMAEAGTIIERGLEPMAARLAAHTVR